MRRVQRVSFGANVQDDRVEPDRIGVIEQDAQLPPLILRRQAHPRRPIRAGHCIEWAHPHAAKLARNRWRKAVGPIGPPGGNDLLNGDAPSPRRGAGATRWSAEGKARQRDHRHAESQNGVRHGGTQDYGEGPLDVKTGR